MLLKTHTSSRCRLRKFYCSTCYLRWFVGNKRLSACFEVTRILSAERILTWAMLPYLRQKLWLSKKPGAIDFNSGGGIESEEVIKGL